MVTVIFILTFKFRNLEMSPSDSILLLELEELKANMNTVRAELSRCMAKVEKVVASVMTVQSGDVNESFVNDNNDDLVDRRINTSGDIDKINKDDNHDCISSRPSQTQQYA